MSQAVFYLLLLPVPGLVFWAAAAWVDRWSRPDGRETLLTRGRTRVPYVPAGPGLERLVDDLRRLEAEYRRVETSDLPAKAARLRALSLAYDDTLRDCCRTLELPEPQRPPLGAMARLQTEAALAQHGLTW